MGFVVVPSVSDGVLNPPSQRAGTTPEQMSKMVFGVVPSVSDGVLNPPSPREGTTPEQMSKMGFGVVPSVSDGVLNPPSQREGTTPEQMSKMGEETNNRYVQRDSKVSELFEKLIAVMFNETPKSRSCLKN